MTHAIIVSSYLSFVSPSEGQARDLHPHQQQQEQVLHHEQEKEESSQEEKEEGGARGGGRGGGEGQRGSRVTERVAERERGQRGPVVIKFNIDHDTFEGACLKGS